MTSLKDLLPAPTDGHSAPEDNPISKPREVTFAPTSSKLRATTSNALVLKQTDHDGTPDYSAIIRQGENATRTVHTRYDAMVEKPRDEALVALPTPTDVDEATRRTKAALEATVSTKLSASSAKPTGKKKAPSTFLKYTPANVSKADSSTSHQRIIKMVQAPIDPMEPPRFTQRKAPVNPPSPPVPVMHSPERKLSKTDAAEWKIPPVVSDWKNNRGYTISLDKRLAADGRQMVDRSINDRFAKMAEALYQAEKNARDDVERRAALQRQVSIRAKAARERELRQLAEKARQDRKGYLGLSERTGADSIADGLSEVGDGVERAVEDDAPPQLSHAASFSTDNSPRGTESTRKRSRFSDKPGTTEVTAEANGDDAAVRRRDEVRRERRLQREREMKMREVHGDESGRATLKRTKLTRDLDRDVSERAALGQAVVGGGPSGEVLYDERLFNQDGGVSLGGGFGADDSYNLYEEALFKGGQASTRMFRGQSNVRRDGEEEKEAENAGSESTRARETAVEFERDDAAAKGDDDPYGLSKFIDDVRGK